jgi:hypothetical protein
MMFVHPRVFILDMDEYLAVTQDPDMAGRYWDRNKLPSTALQGSRLSDPCFLFEIDLVAVVEIIPCGHAIGQFPAVGAEHRHAADHWSTCVATAVGRASFAWRGANVRRRSSARPWGSRKRGSTSRGIARAKARIACANPLQGLEFLPVLEADDVVRRDRLLDRDGGLRVRRRRMGFRVGDARQGSVDVLDQDRKLTGADRIVADVSRDDVGRKFDELRRALISVEFHC